MEQAELEEVEGAMEDKIFKEVVYGPYLDAWKIIKIIQYAGQSEKDQETWNMFMKEIDRYTETYKDNEIAQGLISFIIGYDDYKGAGDIIARLNRGTEDAIQKT